MKKVETYNEYRTLLDGRGDVYVFRGQANSNFVLIPSGLREEHKLDADPKIFAFVDQMKKSFDFDELTCVEIAQHFHLPTRMLDFSYSYDVALFFACYDEKGKYYDEDGKVFIFNKSKYERMLQEQNRQSSHMILSNRYLYSWLQKYIDNTLTHDDSEGIDMPLFVDATQQFDRLYMQKGLFLLWGKDECSFEEIMKKENIDMNSFIDTIVINKKYKKQIIEELRKKHISEDALYMNINGIKELVSNIKYGK